MNLPANRAAVARSTALAVAFYTAVTMAFFSQAGRRLITEAIGDGGDGLIAMWSAWWIKYSLLRGTNPYFCDLIFAPDGTSMVWRGFVPLQAGVMAALGTLLPRHLAYNVVVMAAYPLAGTGTYLLCRYITCRHAASLIGGLAFMCSPFLVSKMNGHVHLLYAGLLPFYLLLLLEASGTSPPRRAAWLLGLVTLTIMITDMTIAVLAANLTVCVVAWRLWSQGPRLTVVRRLLATLAPSFLVVIPFAGLVLFHTWKYGVTAPIRVGASFAPEPLSYLLPLTPTSLYEPLVAHLGSARARQFDFACYLGWLVFPIAVAGLWGRRDVPLVRWCAAVLVLFVTISLGPSLQAGAATISSGAAIPLPFAVWSRIPVLGTIGQTGRYMVIAYLMMAVGIACAVGILQANVGASPGIAVAVLVGTVVLGDYAFKPITTPLPARVPLSSYEGNVLDLRTHLPVATYNQVHHRRPVIGGYAERQRIPPAFVRRSEEDPGLACFAPSPPATIACDRERVLQALAALRVTDVLDSPGSWREPRFRAYGFEAIFWSSHTAVWTTRTARRETPPPP